MVEEVGRVTGEIKRAVRLASGENYQLSSQYPQRGQTPDTPKLSNTPDRGGSGTSSRYECTCLICYAPLGLCLVCCPHSSTS